MAALLFGVPLLWPAQVSAHARSTSYSIWDIAGETVTVRLKVPWLEIARAAPAMGVGTLGDLVPGSAPEEALGAYLVAHVSALVRNRPCPAVSHPERLPGPANALVYRWQSRCPGGSADTIVFGAFFDQAPSHMHIARVRVRAAGGTVTSHEAVLSDTQRTLSLAHRGRALGDHGLASFFLLGVTHIATGYDHLAFLAALLLSAESLGAVVRAVTGFTLGHSLTLGLALGRLITVDRAAAVEALIGLSVAVVAAEPLLAHGRAALVAFAIVALAASASGWLSVPAPALLGVMLFSLAHMRASQRRLYPRALPWLAASAFGLIHGLGFAGAISDLEIGRGALVPVLAGFNLGVEAGQLVALALVLALFGLFRRFTAVSMEGRLRRFASAALVTLGIALFVVRAT
ncbi:MAG: HupE/UreJ family protein [Candidatus Binatia bacterium]